MITPDIGFNTLKQSVNMYKPIEVETILKTFENTRAIEDILTYTTAIASNIAHNTSEVTKLIKESGIIDVRLKNNNICLVSNKGNGFWIKPSIILNDEAANILILNELKNSNNFFGIPAFIKMADTLRRPDIVKKGLNINSNELKFMNLDEKEEVASKLSKKLRKNVKANDIFSLSNGIYYPDIKNLTVYQTRLTKDKLNNIDIVTCKFIPDNNKNIIGYERNAYDIIGGIMRNTQYKEQQIPLEKLPNILDDDTPRIYANVYRFGNYTFSDRYKEGIDTVLFNLKPSVPNLTIRDLQGIKFAKGNGRCDVQIAYYSPKSGRSLIFDKFGKFMHRIEYIKDENGNIIDFMKYT